MMFLGDVGCLFWTMNAVLVVEKPIGDLKIPSRSPYLWSLNEYRVVEYRCDSCWVPCQNASDVLG